MRSSAANWWWAAASVGKGSIGVRSRRGPRPERLGEIRVHREEPGHHLVGLERVEQEFWIADLAPHRRLEQRHHARLEDVPQSALVGDAVGTLDLGGGGGAGQASGSRGQRGGGAVDLGHRLEGAVEVQRLGCGLAAGDFGDRALQPLELALLGHDGAAVGEVGEGEGECGEHEDGRRRDRAAAPDPRASFFRGGIEDAEARLPEDDLGQQIVQEEAAALGAPGRRLGLRRQSERGGERGGQAVDRRALLGRRGQVDAAQPRRGLVAALAEDGVDDGPQGLCEGRHLSGKSEDLGPSREDVLAFQPVVQAALELGDEDGELAGGLRPVGAAGGREAGAPDLLALGRAELGEERLEALDEIGLGQHQVDGQADLEAVHELGQALADGAAVRAQGRVAFRERVHRQRDDHAVQRAAAAVLLQEVEEAEPFGGIGLWIAFLLRVASRGVDQDGVLGEEPVAVAGAPDARAGRRRGRSGS
jgi:hypothetical protein